MNSISPKYIFQGLILLFGLLLFGGVILYQRIRTGKSLGMIVTDNKKSINHYMLASFLIFLASLLALAVFNNLRE